MRLFFAIGSGDIVADERERIAENERPRETSITFSQQVSSYCQARGFPALLVSSHPRADKLVNSGCTLINVPKSDAGTRGLSFHMRQIRYARKLALLARQFTADIAIIDTGTVPVAYLVAFKAVGIDVVLNMHNVRWANGFRPRRSARALLNRIDSVMLKNGVSAAMGCSPECGIQARTDGAGSLPFYLWRAQYRLDGFSVEAPPETGGFRIIYAGRVEINKGVLDIIAIAEKIVKMTRKPITFEVCGDGEALGTLRSAVVRSSVASRVSIRGRLGRADLLGAYSNAHAALVPTRSQFCEGMPLACAEAILSGRPVITSRLSNARPVIGPAAIEVDPENIDQYARAIVLLAEDRDVYERARMSCASAAVQFFDRSLGISAALDSLLVDRSPGLEPWSDFESLYN